MKDYPRIYSLSTIGLIRHGNMDYLFHPLRTDFSGESGSGKSMIADFLQLIFVGKTAFQSSTDTKGPDERKVPGMVLKKERIGYAFVNLEVGEKQYVVLGVYIEKQTKKVKLFILQKGYGGKDENEIIPLSKPVFYQDLIIENAILPIEDLTQEMLVKSYVCQVFRTKKYHEILFKNQIIPLDLSQDEKKLNDYAQIIRSFARGKGVRINSQGLKDFLFRDKKDEELWQQYQREVKDIEGALKEHYLHQTQIDETKQKQQELVILKKLKNRRDKSYEEWLIQSILLYLSQCSYYERKIGSIQRNLLETRLAVNFLKGLEQFLLKNQYEEELQEVCKKKEEGKNIQKFLTSSEEERERIKEEQKICQHQHDRQKDLVDKVKRVEVWLQKFRSWEKLKQYYKDQQENERSRRQLSEFISFIQSFQGKDYRESLKASFWFEKEYQEAIQNYEEKREKLNEEIKSLNALQTFSNLDDPNSLASWALKEKRRFNREEESILVYFQTFPRQKPQKATLGERYLPIPEELFKEPKIEDHELQGFWISLQGVREFIPYAPNPFFANRDPEEIRKFFNQNYQTFRSQLKQKTKEFEDLDNLKQCLIQSGNVTTNIILYRKREKIENFSLETDFPDNQQNFDNLLSNYDSHQNAQEQKELFDQYQISLELIIKQSISLSNIVRVDNQAIHFL